MRQPDKNRYLRAIQHIESEDVCFQEDEFETTVTEQIMGRQLPLVRSYELPAADLIELNTKVGNDLVFLANLWEFGRKNIIDENGRKHYVDGTIKTRSDLQGITFPDLGDICRRIEEVLQASKERVWA